MADMPKRNNLFITHHEIYTSANFQHSKNRGVHSNKDSDSSTISAGKSTFSDLPINFHPNIADFLPNDQEIFVFEETQENDKFFFLKVLIAIVLAFVVILLLAEIVIIKSKSDKLVDDIASNNISKKDLKLMIYFEERLFHINKKIIRLTKEFANLSKIIDETGTWKNTMAMEIEKLKFEGLRLNMECLEKVNKNIEETLDLYDADKVGMRDFALASTGGEIAATPDTIPFPVRSSSYLGVVNIHFPSNPTVLLQPETLPGQCFAFKGQYARITIKLSNTVNITAVTLEHAHRSLVEDIHSAPKDFKVYGLEQEFSEVIQQLGSFTYQINGKPLQTFYIKENYMMDYQYVELRILTNHGHPEYTCIYRFRVHGSQVDND